MNQVWLNVLNPARAACLAVSFCFTGLASAADTQAHASKKEASQERESIFFGPLANYIIPGVTHIYYGRYGEGTLNLGLHAAANLGMYHKAKSFSKEEKDIIKKGDQESYEYEQLALFNKDLIESEVFRGVLIGNRGISVYNAFRDAVDTYQGSGEFDFLKERESTSDLLLSPFRFDHLAKPTTLGYLLMQGLSTYFVVDERLKNRDKFEARKLTGYHMGMRVPLHFGASIGEETVYRGWMMPLMQHATGNRWVANGLQSALFGLVHDGNFGGHALFGFYTGWVVQRNGGQLSESIFAHAWGNLIGQAGAYMAVRKKDPEAARRMTFMLSDVTIPF